MIWEVRDPIENRDKESADPGVADKRLFVVESELASPLERMASPGNTLSAVLRQAWDGEKLDTLVKTNRATSTGAHLSMVGHITVDELRRKLTATEQANGFANRFLWIHASRSKLLSRGGRIEKVRWTPMLSRLESALADAVTGTIELTDQAWTLWDRLYEDLSTPPGGMLGSLTARGPAQVRRLALIYALLDSEGIVTIDHMRAAFSVWRYAADSAAVIFGHSLGDPTADTLLTHLREKPEGLTTKEIHGVFSGHRSAEEIERALGVLSNQDLVTSEKRSTGGRPVTRWRTTDDASAEPPERAKRTKRPKPKKRRSPK